MLTGLLHRLDPERAHGIAIRGLSLGLAPRQANARWPRLKSTLATLALPNPLGLAAGFDKNAEALPGLQKLGFGWIEIGTVTPRPQVGNPRPRIFRLAEDRAIINRLGFNNKGLDAVRGKLAQRRPSDGVIGANIGANRDTPEPVSDYVTCLEGLYGLADYFTINVSSPNTPGLRDLQGKARLSRLLDTLVASRKDLSRRHGETKPLFLKIAPDLAEEDEADVADVALTQGIEALIIANTTLDRPHTLISASKTEAGGLSGRPLCARSTTQISRFRDLTGGRLPLIGVGGIDSGETAYAKIRAGASALQLYTGFVYGGPALIPAILDELDGCLQRDGFTSLGEAVGIGREERRDDAAGNPDLTQPAIGA
jgi:dihydroorotate dehydrogenase